ncbi:MAG: hypothetical protein QXJ68_07815 [Methanocellales archaeon]
MNARLKCPECGALLRIYPHWNSYAGCINPACLNNIENIRKRGFVQRINGIQKTLF